MPPARPSREVSEVIAAVTLWRSGNEREALEILNRLGKKAVQPLFGFYVGLLQIHEAETGENAGELVERIALRLARAREGLS